MKSLKPEFPISTLLLRQAIRQSPPRVKLSSLCFFTPGARLRNLHLSQVWEFRLLLLECPCNDSPGSRTPGTGREIPYAPDARCNRRSTGGRARRTAVAADAGPCKARCAIRRGLPDY